MRLVAGGCAWRFPRDFDGGEQPHVFEGIVAEVDLAGDAGIEFNSSYLLLISMLCDGVFVFVFGFPGTVFHLLFVCRVVAGIWQWALLGGTCGGVVAGDCGGSFVPSTIPES